MNCYNKVENCECTQQNIAEIDDLISETIQILNKKGYKTTACCSGHNYDVNDISRTYILFKYDYNFSHLPPCDFKVIESRFSIDLRWIHKAIVVVESDEQLCSKKKLSDINESLLDWAIELSPIASEDIKYNYGIDYIRESEGDFFDFIDTTSDQSTPYLNEYIIETDNEESLQKVISIMVKQTIMVDQIPIDTVINYLESLLKAQNQDGSWTIRCDEAEDYIKTQLVTSAVTAFIMKYLINSKLAQKNEKQIRNTLNKSLNYLCSTGLFGPQYYRAAGVVEQLQILMFGELVKYYYSYHMDNLEFSEMTYTIFEWIIHYHFFDAIYYYKIPELRDEVSATINEYLNQHRSVLIYGDLCNDPHVKKELDKYNAFLENIQLDNCWENEQPDEFIHRNNGIHVGILYYISNNSFSRLQKYILGLGRKLFQVELPINDTTYTTAAAFRNV